MVRPLLEMRQGKRGIESLLSDDMGKRVLDDGVYEPVQWNGSLLLLYKSVKD